MKIRYNFVELANKEFELEHQYANPKFGFEVQIFLENGEVHNYFNLTEIHHMYDDENLYIAFESDIHSCGRTMKIDTIKHIDIFHSFSILPSWSK